MVSKRKKETKVNRAWLESGKEYVLTSVNHCRNVIFPLLSSLFSGWLLTWESNETFGVRTKVIPIEVFCIADSECVIFIYLHLLLTRGLARERLPTV